MARQEVPVNVYREGDRVMVAAPLPGMEPGSIRLDVQGRALTIDASLRGPGQDRTQQYLVNSSDQIRMEKTGTAGGRRVRHTGNPARRTG